MDGTCDSAIGCKFLPNLSQLLIYPGFLLLLVLAISDVRNEDL